MDIGERIKKERERLGYTQSKLAKEVGVSTRTIQRFESDKNATNILTLEKVARGLGLHVNDLISAEGGKFNTKLMLAWLDSGLSDKEFFKATGLSEDRFTGFAVGLYMPTEGEYKKISEVTGVDVEKLKPQDDDTETLKEDALYSSVFFALKHIPKGNKKREEDYINRLSKINRIYGEMSQHMCVMGLSSKEKPDEYIRFMQNYERLLRLVREHKEDVINGAFEWIKTLKESDSSKLEELIYGDDPE